MDIRIWDGHLRLELEIGIGDWISEMGFGIGIAVWDWQLRCGIKIGELDWRLGGFGIWYCI